MIGKGKSISHTKASIEYGWNQEKDAIIVFKNYLIGSNPTEITQEFKNIQALNYQCKRNTLSFVLSPTIEDGQKLSKSDLSNITAKFITELKLEEYQSIAFIHQDKDHKHIHLYVNRINFKGEAYNDSYIGKRSQKVAENVANAMNLKTVKQVQKDKLDDIKTLRYVIKMKSDQSLQKTRSFQDYIGNLKTKGVDIKPVINKLNQIQGFQYTYANRTLKGSKVHRELSINNLVHKISFNIIDVVEMLEQNQIIINNKAFKLHYNLKNSIEKKYNSEIKKQLINNKEKHENYSHNPSKRRSW